MWDLARSGIKPRSLALVSGFFTTESPGKPKDGFKSQLKENKFLLTALCSNVALLDKCTWPSESLPAFGIYQIVITFWPSELGRRPSAFQGQLLCPVQGLALSVLNDVPEDPDRSLCACMLSHFSHVRLFATLWTVACQAPLSMEFSRQE